MLYIITYEYEQTTFNELRESCRALSNFTLRNLTKMCAISSGKWCEQVHKKPPPLLGSPQGPGQTPSVGSWGQAVSHE